MKTTFRSSLLFASVPFVLGVLADLLLAVFYQGAQPAELREQMLITHGLLFASILVLSFLGAFIAFFFRRARLPSRKAIALLGLLYSVASFFMVVIAFGFGGPVALGAWLFFGAMVFAASGTFINQPNHG